jgi:glyoxylase-like metal-dependent hydrolase (beta-lactamase superfamily II)
VIRDAATSAPLAARPNPDRAPRLPRVNRAPSVLPYTRGLHEVGKDIWAWLAPDGGYGLSNAGLVAGTGASLLVDTFYDLHLTREMLTAMRPITDRRPLTHAILTHANGDHTFGNQLLDGTVRIVAAAATTDEMTSDISPDMMAGIQAMDLGPVLGPYLHDRFGCFDFGGIRRRLPDETFDSELTLDIGGPGGARAQSRAGAHRGRLGRPHP